LLLDGREKISAEGELLTLTRPRFINL
jgi:hypothetical protein